MLGNVVNLTHHSDGLAFQSGTTNFSTVNLLFAFTDIETMFSCSLFTVT
jgi:hypothetical protein